MRKYLIALAVALMVCMLGISASAEERSTDSEEYKAAEKEQEAIAQECYKIMDEIDPKGLDVRTQMRIMSEVYEKAGWTVTKQTPEMARGTYIDPKVWELAHSDIDKASPEQREKIIDAREFVAGNYSWHNDIAAPNSVSYVINPFDREIIFPLLYSELFPGWDQPRPSCWDGEAADTAEPEQESADAESILAASVEACKASIFGSLQIARAHMGILDALL